MCSPENWTNLPGMTEHAEPRDPDVRLHVALTKLLGRRVTNSEIWTAFGVSKARYYQIAKEEGDLLRPDRLVSVGRHLGVNPMELLVELTPSLTIGDAEELVAKKYRELEGLQRGSSFGVLTRERSLTQQSSLPTTKLSSFTGPRDDAPPL